MRSFSRDAALVLIEAELSLEVILALGTVVFSGLSFQLSRITLFRFLRVGARDLAIVDFAACPLGVLGAALGILNRELSNLSTGFEILPDLLMDEFSFLIPVDHRFLSHVLVPVLILQPEMLQRQVLVPELILQPGMLLR